MVSEDWRSIDIDALEPDAHLTKEDLLPTDIPPTTNEQVQQVANQIRSNLSSGQFQQALSLALDNVPYVADLSTKNYIQRLYLKCCVQFVIITI